MSGRRALLSAWRVMVRGLTVASWAEKGSYYNVTATGDAAAPADVRLTTPA